jgi:SAM-dependent methyltransferase
MEQAVAKLLDEAAAAPLKGWDFSWSAGRITISPLPWDYAALAAGALHDATTALDMGTGGGEFLDRFSVFPPRLVATESWPPNVPVAASRLGGRGVPVIHSEDAAENARQAGEGDRGRLPFCRAAFDLVLNRHEAFNAAEVARVLAPGGRFLTQQAGSAPDQFHALLGLRPSSRPAFDLTWLKLVRRFLAHRVPGCGWGRKPPVSSRDRAMRANRRITVSRATPSQAQQAGDS